MSIIDDKLLNVLLRTIGSVRESMTFEDHLRNEIE